MAAARSSLVLLAALALLCFGAAARAADAADAEIAAALGRVESQLAQLADAVALLQQNLGVVEYNAQTRAELGAARVSREAMMHYRQLEALIGLYGTGETRMPTPLPPLREWRVSPDIGAQIAAAVRWMRPRTIVEFGSGASTLIAAHELKRIAARDNTTSDEDARGALLAFDHSALFASISTQHVRRHELEAFARIVHAPLEPVHYDAVPTGGDGDARVAIDVDWYSRDVVRGVVEALSAAGRTIDMLIVDGPPAFSSDERNTTWNRYPALAEVFGALSPHAIIVVDDAEREAHVSAAWRAEFCCFESFYDQSTEKGAEVLRRTPQRAESVRLPPFLP